MKLTAKMKAFLDAEKELVHATAMRREWERVQYHARKRRDAARREAFGNLKGYATLKG